MPATTDPRHDWCRWQNTAAQRLMAPHRAADANDDFMPHAAVKLDLSGSNSCEDEFSSLGGFGAVAVQCRNFTANGEPESLGDRATLQLYQYMGDDPLRMGSRHHGADVDIDLHEDTSRPPADLSGGGHPANHGALG